MVEYLFAGFSVGGQYALIAIGYTMVYGILRLINFAHGDLFMVSGIIMIYLSASLPVYISIPLVILLTVLLGVLIERVAYKPLRSAPRMSVMISAIGVSYLLQNFVLYITGGLVKKYPSLPFLGTRMTLFGIKDKMVIFVTPVVAIVLMLLLMLLIKKTKIGLAMRAASTDFETAQLMGVKINRVISFTFIVGSALAAVGSMLYFTKFTGVSPTAGALPGLKAFIAAVFGGIGSIPGAVIGAMFIGIIENLAVALDLALYKDAFTFALLIIVLVVKPTGLFGEKMTEKV
ncbi:MAG: branched-chain amino acid ABC transporter permease [Ruminococcaceae bacterium]|nr:branched-chain amino acid ABC transporter permease [Oscillospiraceae bacterium]